MASAAPDGSSVCVESGWITQSFFLAPFEGQNVSFSFGIFDDFTSDRLFRFLNALGGDIEIVIRPARRAAQAETRVVTV